VKDPSVPPTSNEGAVWQVNPKTGKVLSRRHLGNTNDNRVSAAFTDLARRRFLLYVVHDGDRLRGYRMNTRHAVFGSAWMPTSDSGAGTAMNRQHLVVTFSYLNWYRTPLGRAVHGQWRWGGRAILKGRYRNQCDNRARVPAAAFLPGYSPRVVFFVLWDDFNPACGKVLMMLNLRTRKVTVVGALPDEMSDITFGPCPQ